MPLPESFNANAFDAVDLWHVTENLIGILPGLHIANISEPIVNDNRLSGEASLCVALAASPIEDAKISISQLSVKGTLLGAYETHHQIRQTMGKATVNEERTVEADPESVNREAQQGLIKRFLPLIQTVTLTQKPSKKISYRTGADGDPLTTVTAPTFHTIERRHDFIDRHYIVSVANFNLRLGKLIGEEAGTYEQIADRAASWEAGQDIAPSLGWLAPRRPAMPKDSPSS